MNPKGKMKKPSPNLLQLLRLRIARLETELTNLRNVEQFVSEDEALRLSFANASPSPRAVPSQPRSQPPKKGKRNGLQSAVAAVLQRERKPFTYSEVPAQLHPSFRRRVEPNDVAARCSMLAAAKKVVRGKNAEERTTYAWDFSRTA